MNMSFKPDLYFFHTIEIILLLLFSSYFFHWYLFLIIVGFLFHFVEQAAEALELPTDVILSALKRAKVLNKTYDFEVFLNQLTSDPDTSARFGPDLFNLVEASKLKAAWEQLKSSR